MPGPASFGPPAPADAITGRAKRAVSTSVSDVAPIAPPPVAGSPASSASSRVLIRLPLWPSARLADGVARNVGWAFCHIDDPLVEYLQCPTAM